jgi:hypothetical protein
VGSKVCFISRRGARIGSDVFPLKQNLITVHMRGQLIQERKPLGPATLTTGIHASLGIVRIGGHFQGPISGILRILDKLQRVLGSIKVFGSTSQPFVTCPDFHMTIVMSIQIGFHQNDITLHILLLGEPWHGIAILVEPFVIGTRSEPTADVVVEVETVLTIFGGRTCLAGAGGAFLMGVDIPGSGRVKIPMTIHKYLRG